MRLAKCFQVVIPSFLIVLLISVACLAQTKSPENAPPIPRPRTEYLGRTIAPTMSAAGAKWLVRAARERQERCSELLRSLPIKPGQTVCDLGCGNGFYSMKLAGKVGPKGKVLAVDIQQEMLDLLVERATARQIKNIKPILGTVTNPNLPEALVDFVLLVDVYHEFSYPEEMLKAIHKSLKPNGQVVLVEFRLEDPKVPIKLLHKMSQDQIIRELNANQFKLVNQTDRLPWQHVMIFARDDSPLKSVTLSRWKPIKKPREKEKTDAKNTSSEGFSYQGNSA